jgi:DNA-binding HxlR family transcriptional regulator
LKRMTKTLVALSLSAIMFTPNTLADTLGQIDQSSLISLQEERVHNLVANSADIRSSIETGRSVAGVSENDQKWAQEYQNLMQDESEKDYLEMALKL